MYYKLGQLCFITNQGKRCLKLGQLHYYKLGQPLLQKRAAITNWGKMYCKLRQVLQIRVIITYCGIRYVSSLMDEVLLLFSSYENVYYVGLCNFYLETEIYRRLYCYNTRNFAALHLWHNVYHFQLEFQSVKSNINLHRNLCVLVKF